DATVADLHLAALGRALDDAGIRHDAIVVPAGEQTKSFEELARVVDALLAARIQRDTALIALGGGVVGDLGGVAASTALRRSAFVQRPTTRPAQVDTPGGGKTGITTSRGKNLVGSFYPPRRVLAAIDARTPRPRRRPRAGCAGVVKYG